MDATPTRSPLALTAAAATGVQVGAAIVASRFVVNDVPPLTLALLRYVIGFFCLLPFAIGPLRQALRTRRQQVQAQTARLWRDVGVMALLGIGQFAVLIALMNFGLQSVGAAQASLIFSLFPLFTLLLSTRLGHERITPALFAGVLLSIVGVALSLAPKLATPHGSHWWGEVAVLTSAGVGALCSVLYRPYLRRYPTVPVSTFAMASSVVFLAALALPEGWPARLLSLGPATWTVVAFIGVSSGIGYFWWLYALKHESPTRVTVFLALNPVTAILLSTIWLGEPLTAWSIAAVACITGGLGLATRSSPVNGN
jgi:drug/metabolite transporter (DMT)-like permease